MLEIHRTEDRIEVHVEGGAVFPLPSPADLKFNALAAADDFCGPNSLAAEAIANSDFDYEIVPGKDAIEKLIAVVVTTSPEYAEMLHDPSHEIQPDFWGAIMEACPDAGDSRVVVRGT